MRLFLLGATGLVGREALRLALSNAAISEVIAPTRTPMRRHEKLVNPVTPKLEELASNLKSFRADAIICALGTTQAKAGSKQAFRYVDHDLPVEFGKAAHAAGIETYAIVTAMGASVNSRIFYSRTKGEVERDIQQIGFRSLTICRPSLIGGEREEARRAEAAALTLARWLDPVLPKKFRINQANTIAANLLDAVIASQPGCRWIYADEMN